MSSTRLRAFLPGMSFCGIAAVLWCATAQAAPALTLHVAPDGNDAWSGTPATPNSAKTDGPLASLQRARDLIRQMKKSGALPAGGVRVELAPGFYQREATLELTAEDSGTEAAPIEYAARAGGPVTISGGRIVRGFGPVTDPAVLQRLPEEARGKVLQADLRAQGVSDFGEAKGGGLELFFNDEPMTLARGPNDGFLKIEELAGVEPFDSRGRKGDRVGRFVYEGDRPSRWAPEQDPWVHGYWFHDWSDQRHKVESIDRERRLLSVAPPFHGYGYRKGQWFYGFNLLCEIDSPGEWYLDRQRGVLYFWPPSPIEQGTAVVSVQGKLVAMKDVSHVTFRGLTFEACRDTAITASGGSCVRIVGCTLRNTGAAGVSMSGGTSHAVVGCDLSGMAAGGIGLSGGDRKTLTPCGHLAENNHVHHYGRWRRMYSAGIALHGVGVRAAHNLIHNAPHQAMGFSGNDHVIELNEIHSVCYESNDAGAIYAGRDWTMRGTQIRYNFMHHLCGREGRGCVGVYLDDMYSGTAIFGNLFWRVPRAAFVGGGRDNLIENNIFVDCTPALHIDSRALGWASAAAAEDGVMRQRLKPVPYQNPLWASRYPKLVGILDDEPATPKGNVVARNVCFGGRWDEGDAKARPHVSMQDNLVDQDPHFVAPDRGDFQLRPDSPAYKLGFKPLPIEKMGLVEDPARASWPVEHAIRPMIEKPAPPARGTKK